MAFLGIACLSVVLIFPRLAGASTFGVGRLMASMVGNAPSRDGSMPKPSEKVLSNALESSAESPSSA